MGRGSSGSSQGLSPAVARASPDCAPSGWLSSNLSSLVFPEATAVTSSFLLKLASVILFSETRTPDPKQLFKVLFNDICFCSHTQEKSSLYT